MKRLILMFILSVIFVGCLIDKTPISPVSPVKVEWRALKIQNVQFFDEIAHVTVWDRIENDFLEEIKLEYDSEQYNPIFWEYLYSEKDKHVYLVRLQIKVIGK